MATATAVQDSTVDRARAIRARIAADPLLLFPFLQLKPKDDKGKRARSKDKGTIPFHPNSSQMIIHRRVWRQWTAHHRFRIIVLKARQVGISTYFQALSFWRIAFDAGINAQVIGNDALTSKWLYAMCTTFKESLNNNAKLAFIRPTTTSDNIKGVAFTNNSRLDIDTPKTKKTAGRARTNHIVHATELGFWDNAAENMSGLLQSLPDDDSFGIIESTANGVGGEFHSRFVAAMTGQSEWEALFIPWFQHEEYHRAVPDGYVFAKADRRVQEEFKLTDEQLYWRRYKIDGDMNGDERLFHQEFPATWEEAFLVSGRCFFIPENLALHRTHIKAPKFIGEVVLKGAPGPMPTESMSVPQFTDSGFWSEEPAAVAPLLAEGMSYRPDFQKRLDGRLRIWSWLKRDRATRKVDRSRNYVIGVDTSEGLEVAQNEVDRSAAMVFDRTTGRQVAGWRGLIDPFPFGDVLYALGMYYNSAYIVLEVNNHGAATMRRLLELAYPNLYMRTRSTRQNELVSEEPGWYTGTASRKFALDNLLEAMHRFGLTILDDVALSEFTSFVVDAKGKADAQQGCHDDHVIAAALAWEGFRLSPQARRPKAQQLAVADFTIASTVTGW